jgi:hypothetical protein
MSSTYALSKIFSQAKSCAWDYREAVMFCTKILIEALETIERESTDHNATDTAHAALEDYKAAAHYESIAAAEAVEEARVNYN